MTFENFFINYGLPGLVGVGMLWMIGTALYVTLWTMKPCKHSYKEHFGGLYADVPYAVVEKALGMKHPSVPGGCHLDRPLDGFRWWNVTALARAKLSSTQLEKLKRRKKS